MTIKMTRSAAGMRAAVDAAIGASQQKACALDVAPSERARRELADAQRDLFDLYSTIAGRYARCITRSGLLADLQRAINRCEASS